MAEKVKFGSKIGLIAATLGSAVGLGNVWRFPSVTQENGGAAFLIIYLVCVLVLGIPVMLAEFSIGRGGNADSVTSYRKLSPGKKWYFNGILGVVSSYVILTYYIVVAGWTIQYLGASVTGSLFDTVNGNFNGKMEEMIATDWSPVYWTWAMIAINFFVLINGINKGIEKLSNILMPMLFLVLLIFAIVSLNLPKAQEGLEYFLYPDFSKVTPKTFVHALGQTFYSLSLGMGILVTYASYYKKETKLTKTATTVSLLGSLVAVLMGMVIFPAVTNYGLNTDPDGLKGTTLIFVTLPEVFVNMPFSRLWATLFFFLLGVAALTSTISLGEVSISLLQDHFKMKRLKACLVVFVPMLLLSTVNALSLGVLSDITIMGYNIFDFLDHFTTNYMLPTCAFIGCIYVGWALPKKYLENELTNFGTFKSYVYKPVLFSIRFVAPVLMIIILLSQFFNF